MSPRIPAGLAGPCLVSIVGGQRGLESWGAGRGAETAMMEGMEMWGSEMLEGAWTQGSLGRGFGTHSPPDSLLSRPLPLLGIHRFIDFTSRHPYPPPPPPHPAKHLLFKKKGSGLDFLATSSSRGIGEVRPGSDLIQLPRPQPCETSARPPPPTALGVALGGPALPGVSWGPWGPLVTLLRSLLPAATSFPAGAADRLQAWLTEMRFRRNFIASCPPSPLPSL